MQFTMQVGQVKHVSVADDVTSSDPTVVDVEPGLFSGFDVMAVSPGEAVITATWGALSGQIDVTVVPSE